MLLKVKFWNELEKLVMACNFCRNSETFD